jgi:hypothetical protein
MHGNNRLWSAALVVLLLLPAVIGAQDAVPVDKQANLLLKALGYDRGLKKRAPEGIRILVVHHGAAKTAGKIAVAFTTAGTSKVKGLAVTASAAEFKDVKDLLQKADAGEFNMLFVDPSAKGALSSLQQVTRGRKLLSLGGNHDLVKQGLSMGVYLKKGVPRLIINQRAAKVEGLDLAPAIRLIATTIK